MARARRSTVIAGAGIAGLTTALALARAGIESRIVERETELPEAGAGVQLSPNATRILRSLGLLDELRAAALAPEAVVMRDARSLREIGRVRLGAWGERRWGAPYLAIHRADLQRILLEAARQAGSEIEFGAEALGAVVTDDRAVLRMRATRASGPSETDCGLVIAADGVWSRLRAAVPGAAPARPSGHVAWRTRAKPDSAAGRELAAVVGSRDVVTFTHPRLHMVCYPLRNAADFNLVMIAKGSAIREGWSQQGERRDLDRILAGVAAPLRALGGADWKLWPIHECKPGGAWTAAGGLVLIGDAAHAMSPHAAQGAASAIEDAAALARLLREHGDDQARALAEFATERRPRIRRIVARGRLNRFAWQAAGPVALARNAVFRLKGPEGLARDLDWLYGEVVNGEW